MKVLLPKIFQAILTTFRDITFYKLTQRKKKEERRNKKEERKKRRRKKKKEERRKIEK